MANALEGEERICRRLARVSAMTRSMLGPLLTVPMAACPA